MPKMSKTSEVPILIEARPVFCRAQDERFTDAKFTGYTHRLFQCGNALSAAVTSAARNFVRICRQCHLSIKSHFPRYFESMSLQKLRANRGRARSKS